MEYISTRGKAEHLNFFDVTLAGLARDGGLYVPKTFPKLGNEDLSNKTYLEVATKIISMFVEDEISPSELKILLEKSYAVFDHKEVIPLHKLDDNLYIMELFHGPTLAFKDIALQLLGNLFEHILKQRNTKINIVGATSGDTGSAAINAVMDRDNINTFIMHPKGRVSEVQRRQMTTVISPNIFNIAVEGSFDDCQDIVKALFNDQEFRDEMNLSAINSINWARIMAQIVYYVYVSSKLYKQTNKKVTFSVPTGNFGNIYAGYIAKQIGAPIDKLIVATNQNDILHRFVNSGEMKIDGVTSTLSPSMDIQISSNFERLLFELYDRDSKKLEKSMNTFREKGSFKVEPSIMTHLKETFISGRISDDKTLKIIETIFKKSNYMIDPHTAVGLGVAQEYKKNNPNSLIVSLATAHPAKFPEAIKKATGIKPELPEKLADLYEKEENYSTAPADIVQIKTLIKAKHH